MKTVFSKKALSFGTFLCLGLLAACGDSTTVASADRQGSQNPDDSKNVYDGGYYTETYSSCGSSRTLAKGDVETACINVLVEYVDVFKEAKVKGFVKDPQGNALKNASVFLLKSGVKNLARMGGDYGRDIKAASDGNGKFETLGMAVYGLGANASQYLKEEFETEEVPEGFYSYKFAVVSADGAYAAMIDVAMDSLAVDSTGSSVYIDIGNVVAEPSHDLEITFNKKNPEVDGAAVGRTLCSQPLEVCSTVTEEDMERGSVILKGVPAGDYTYCFYGKDEQTGDEMTGCTLSPIHVGE